MSLIRTRRCSRIRPAPTAQERESYARFLFVLLLLQPLLDTYYLYTTQVARLTGGVTLPPILVVLAVFGMAGYYFLRYRGGETGKLLLLYGLLCAVYFVLHHLNCRDFNSFSPTDFGYSVVHELYYVARLLVPMLLIYLVWELNLSRSSFVRISCLLSALCSGVIVLSDLLQIGLCSYTNEAIYGSFLHWTQMFSTEELLPKYFACKGYFSYANQISVLLTGLFPLVCFQAVKAPSWYRSGNVLLTTLAMLCLGTMTATIGVVLELGTMAVIVLVWLVYYHKEFRQRARRLGLVCLTFAATLAMLAVLFPLSPAIQNIGVKDSNSIGRKMGSLSDERIEEIRISSERDDETYRKNCTYVEYNYEDAGIAWRFVYVYYPYQYDPEFWVAMIQNYTVGDNNNYRSLQARIMERVSAVDGSPYNGLLGISATRETNIVKVERDLLAQYYSMGSIGVALFFGGYFATVLVTLVSVLRAMRRRCFPVRQVMLAMSFCVMLCMGYYCGNSLDGTFLSTYLGISAGVLLCTATRRSEE